MTRRLGTCLLVALALRLLFVFVGFPCLESRWNLREDGDGYGEIAQTIREGRYDDVTCAPVYPMFVAAAGSPLTVKIAQSALDALTGLLIFWLAGRRIWAAWLWALYPFAIWRVAFINKEIVVAFLLVAYVLVQLRAQTVRDWIVAGVMLGVLNLAKPVFLLWPVALLFVAPRRAGWALVAMTLVIAPWTYRNWRLTGGEFLPVATEHGGLAAFAGNYRPTLGLWESPGKAQLLAAIDRLRAQHADATTVQFDRVLYREGFRGLRFDLFARKCWRFWFLSAAQRERALSFVIQAGYLV